MKNKTRQEHDSLGTLSIPFGVYYGIQTARAKENFPISGIVAHPTFIYASAMVKMAAAKTNMQLKKLNKKTGQAIVHSAKEVMEGKFNDQFVVDVYQAGAGTSHNMNTNEVIANRAIEILGEKKGDYGIVHPNDHVNMSQSTNDVIPSAMRVTILLMVKQFLPVLDDLRRALEKKGKEFDNIIKSGRTHLQDAAPIRLGQEFTAYSVTIKKGTKRILNASIPLHTLGLGGSAVGTGLNTHPQYRKQVISCLAKISGLPLKKSENMVESMQSMADFVLFSSSLKTLAADLIRIANDLRLLSSGPTTGLHEITLPPVQPGSSIMPGKVNPVMAEVVNMVCFQVIGYDLTVTMASQAGQLELNVMMPIINYTILSSLQILKNVISTFTNRCIAGITANKDRCKIYLEGSMGVATILNQHIGYEKAAEVVKESVKTGKTLISIVKEKSLLPEGEIKKILNPQGMTTVQKKN